MKGPWGLGFDTFSCILFFCNNKSPWKQSLLQNQKPIRVLALHHLTTLHTSTLFSISSFGGGIIRDLADFISFNDEIPFAKPIPIPRPQITSIPSWASSCVPKWLPRFPDSFISCSVSERKCGERLWEDSVLGGAGFGLVDLLLGLCLCFWVCGFWFSILRS